ncbi:hypothetical protein GCM10009839_44480 [Catenulispora yoronensis]|uniref:Polyprenyl synthetase n=1 Tax=Catenulispora yoronensis TaxID=450799 RepID=A0ABP5G5A8_9ACTN
MSQARQPADGEQAHSAHPGRDVFTLLAGIADLGLDTAETLIGKARGVLSRSDLPEIAADAHHDLKARGDAVLGRITPPPESHMETLARLARPTTPDGA